MPARTAHHGAFRIHLLRLWQVMVYYAMEATLWCLWFRNRGRVIGRPPAGPAVLAPNHASFLDWLLLYVMCRRKFGRRIVFLAKAKVSRHPVLGALVHHCRAIVLDDAQPLRAARLAVQSLKPAPGRPAPLVAIFPEGTRSVTGERLPSSGGVSWVARQGGVPLVPVALCGFWEVWRPGRRMPTFRRVPLEIHFLDPLPAVAADDVAVTAATMDRVYAVVQQYRDALQAENRRAVS